MNMQINLKDAERKAFRMKFQDGLWDVFLGIVVLQFAIVPIFTDLGWGDFLSSMAMLPIYLVSWLVIRKLKSALITPRLGLVAYQQERLRKVNKITLMMVVTLVLGLIFGLLLYIGGEFGEWFYPVLLGLVVLTTFSAAAYFLDLPRLILYGGLAGLSPVIGQMLYKTINAAHHGFPITFGISGSLMIIVGLVLFVQFLNKYPLPDPGEEIGLS